MPTPTDAAPAASELHMEELEAENKRLRDILDKFPRTADGQTVTPGMKVYCPHGHEAHNQGGYAYCTKGQCWDDGCQNDSGSGTRYSFEECRAALAAVKKEAP